MTKRIFFLFIVAAALASSCSAYQVSDLPAGWGIDPNQIHGTLLPAYAGSPAADDPNTWLMEVGDFRREGTTNQWVASLAWVSTGTSDSLELHHDIDTGYSQSWVLDGWVKPGPNYKVIDAVSWPIWTLFVPRARYTIVVIGVPPADALPELY